MSKKVVRKAWGGGYFEYTPSRRRMEEERLRQKRREQAAELAKLKRAVHDMEKSVFTKEGSWRVYGSARNTENGWPLFVGDDTVDSEGPRGPPGPPGVPGSRGPPGVAGANGLDGNADMLIIDAVGTSGFNQFGNMNWRISGSSDFLASEYVIRSSGTSSQIHWGQWGGTGGSVVTAMLFKPGVYKVTFQARQRQPTEFAYGFDIDHNHRLAVTYAFPTQEGTGFGTGGPGSSVVYRVTNNTNFYMVEQIPSVEGKWWADTGFAPQLTFERVGHVEPSGTDDTLTMFQGMPSPNATVLLTGDFDWAVPGGSAPPAGYHPNDHPSNGGTNEWAVIEQAADSGSTALSWVHRIRRFI